MKETTRKAIEYQIETIAHTWLTDPTNPLTNIYELEEKLNQAHALFGVMAELEEFRRCSVEEELSEAGDVFYYLIAALLSFNVDLKAIESPPYLRKEPPEFASYAQKYFRGNIKYHQIIIDALIVLLKHFDLGYYGEDLQSIVEKNREKLLFRKENSQLAR
jgi:hypothetical protein